MLCISLHTPPNQVRLFSKLYTKHTANVPQSQVEKIKTKIPKLLCHKGFGIWFFLGFIPTGIISAGFVDQYSRIKRISEYANEQEINFMKVTMTDRDLWTGRAIKDLGIPRGIIVAAIQRGKEMVVPRGDTVIEQGDTLVLGAEAMGDDHRVELKEIVLKEHNPWNDHPIRELDISRQTVIVMVKRRGKMLIPKGDLVLQEGDKVILYTKMFLSDAETLKI